MTTNVGRLLAGLLLLATATADARPMDVFDHAAVMESLSSMPRLELARWLQDRNLPVPWQQSVSDCPDSGLRVVGRWSYGPAISVDVNATATDTFLFLARGSGVSIIRFRSQDSLTFDLLADINSRALTGHVIAQDTLLYVNCAGVEVYGINNPAEPRLLGHLSATITDFSVTDTFLYTISGDSFRAYSVADPANVRRIGGCRDSGAVMTVSGGYAYLGHRYGLHILDVRDPVQPRRVAAIGADVISVAVRDTVLAFGHYEQGISIYGVTNPASPRLLGSVPDVVAPGLFIPPTCDTVLYTPSLDVISLADPRIPRVLGQVSCPGWDNGVAAAPALNYAFVADDFDGLVAVNVDLPTAPRIDTLAYGGGRSEDLMVDGDRLYVAQYNAGVRIIDVSNPALPSFLGAADTLGTLPRSVAVVARDSFAFIGWSRPPWLRSFGVSDPAHPSMQGGADLFNPPEDMVLRDSWVYVAEGRRFEVVNVARPREPRLVGSCTGDGVAVVVQDSFAYTAAGAIRVTNIARPSSPFVVAMIERGSSNIGLVDSLLVCHPGPAIWYSLANPTAPVPIDSIDMGHWITALDVVNRTLYACSGPAYTTLYAISIENLHQPRVLAQMTLPYAANRIIHSGPYLYVCCWDAGVCILDTLQTGVSEGRPGGEPGQALTVWPSLTRGEVRLRAAGAVRGWRVIDVTGKVVAEGSSTGADIDLSRLAPGVYFVSPASSVKRDASGVTKVVITR